MIPDIDIYRSAQVLVKQHGPDASIPTGCQGIPKSLPDDVLKIWVHAAMRARSGAKEKPRWNGAIGSDLSSPAGVTPASLF